MRVKICGISTEAAVEAANEAGPDYIGFVFAQSRRRVEPGTAKILKSMLRPSIQAVGVFVNAPAEEIINLAVRHVIDLIQLHGDEDEKTIRFLKDHTRLPVIKAVRARQRSELELADRLPCDYLLLDTYREDVYGGAGQSFDWSMIPALGHPFFLAGGLEPKTFEKAAETGACCLDLSSAAETGGVKDPEKMKEIVRQIRRMR